MSKELVIYKCDTTDLTKLSNVELEIMCDVAARRASRRLWQAKRVFPAEYYAALDERKRRELGEAKLATEIARERAEAAHLNNRAAWRDFNTEIPRTYDDKGAWGINNGPDFFKGL